jgi:hypothetical protein
MKKVDLGLIDRINSEKVPTKIRSVNKICNGDF